MKKLLIFTLSVIYTLNIVAQTQDSVKNLGTVEILALRVSTLPSLGATTTLNRDFIKSTNPQSSAHLLENSGQVLVQRSQGGGGSPIMRGFEANKVLMVVDGVRMNNAIFRGGHLQNVITIDPNMLEKVDVLFGANSLMYGSDALGGVMYFHTQQPKLYDDNKFHAQSGATMRYSTNNEITGSVKFNFTKGKFSSLTSFSNSSFGDLKSGSNRSSDYPEFGKRNFYVERINDKDSVVKNANPNLQIGTAYTQYDVLEKLLFAQNQYTTHQINFQLSKSSDIPRYDRLTETDAKGNPTQAEWYYGPQERTMLAYHFDNNRKTIFSDKIQLVAAYQDIQESRNTRGFGKENRTERTEAVEILSVNADIVKIFGKNELKYGVEITHNDVVSTARNVSVKTGAITNASTRYPDGGAQMLTAAAYVTDRFKITENTSILAGVRYNFTKLDATFKDKTFYPFPFNDLQQKHNAVIGNIGFQQKTDIGFSAALTFSSAYRAPNVDDLTKVFESSVGGRLIIPNTNLKAEKTYNVELVLNQKLGEKGAIQVTPFFTRYYDALSLAATKYDGKDTILYGGKKSAVFTSVNLAKANIYGISVSGRCKITPSISLSAYYTYTKGRVLGANGETPLDHIPPVFGKISVDFAKNKVRASVYTLFNGAKKTADYRIGTEDNELYSADSKNGFMPAWYTLNLRASYDILKNLSLQVGFENILDTHYRVYASGVSSSGRNLSFTVRSDF